VAWKSFDEARCGASVLGTSCSVISISININGDSNDNSDCRTFNAKQSQPQSASHNVL
jgi:hypothetical protein